MKRGTGTLVTAAILAAAGWTMVRAQAQAARPPEPDILPALLQEVKGLRAALETMTSAGPRIQLALGRLQLQEARLNTSIKRLEEVRNRLGDLQRSHAEAQEELTALDNAGRTPAPAQSGAEGPTQAQLEEMRIHHRGRLKHLGSELQRISAEEAMLASDVSAEQARWTDLNQRLEDLERSLRSLK